MVGSANSSLAVLSWRKLERPNRNVTAKKDAERMGRREKKNAKKQTSSLRSATVGVRNATIIIADL